MTQEVKDLLRLLELGEKQLLADMINKGYCGGASYEFVNPDGSICSKKANVYRTDNAARAGHYTGRQIGAKFRVIFRKVCEKNGQLGRVISHDANWLPSGHYTFIREEFVKELEDWAATWR